MYFSNVNFLLITIQTKSTFSFIHYELKKIGTGPDFINTADQGIPGFNENII